MKTIHNKTSVRGEFFAPVVVALQQSKHTRDCHDYTDLQHLKSGIGRALSCVASGRAWVQHIQTRFNIYVSVSNFFAALRSTRRINMVQEVDSKVRQLADEIIGEKSDPLAEHSELDGFAVYASDGHTQGASAHEKLSSLGLKLSLFHYGCLSLFDLPMGRSPYRPSSGGGEKTFIFYAAILCTSFGVLYFNDVCGRIVL